MYKKKEPSKRIFLSELLNSIYINKKNTHMHTSYYITTLAEKIYRIKIICSIIKGPYYNFNNTNCRILVEDGTNSIWCYSFNETIIQLKKIQYGDLVQIVGKIRKWKNEDILIIETISPANSSMIIISKAEILLRIIEQKRSFIVANNIYESSENINIALKKIEKNNIDSKILYNIDEMLYAYEKNNEKNINYKNIIILKKIIIDYLSIYSIQIDIDTIIAQFKNKYTISEIEEAIKQLLSEGNIFEPNVGQYCIT